MFSADDAVSNISSFGFAQKLVNQEQLQCQLRVWILVK